MSIHASVTFFEGGGRLVYADVDERGALTITDNRYEGGRERERELSFDAYEAVALAALVGGRDVQRGLEILGAMYEGDAEALERVAAIARRHDLRGELRERSDGGWGADGEAAA